jgi:nicotinamidase-related amidase
MSALLALLQQQGAAANLQTRKALIILGMQNDFLSSEGKLPVQDTAFLNRLLELVPRFRGSGDVIWVKTHAPDDATITTISLPSEKVIITDAAGGKGTRASPKGSKVGVSLILCCSCWILEVLIS